MRRLLLAAVALVTIGAGCAADDTTETNAEQDASATDDAAEDDPGDDRGATDDEADDTSDDADTADDAETDGEATGDGGDVTVAVASSEFGEVLVDAEGMTLYVFDRDERGPSVCEDDCEANWPPLVVDGEPVAGDGVDPDLLDTAERGDGTRQVTYDGWPLYGFVGDQEPGDVAGQAVQDVWWVVEASGAVLRDGAAASDEGSRPSY